MKRPCSKLERLNGAAAKRSRKQPAASAFQEEHVQTASQVEYEKMLVSLKLAPEDLLVMDWGGEMSSVVMVDGEWNKMFPDCVNTKIVLRLTAEPMSCPVDKNQILRAIRLTPTNYYALLSKRVFPPANTKMLYNEDRACFGKMMTTYSFNISLAEYTRKLRADTLAALHGSPSFKDVDVYWGRRPEAVANHATLYAPDSTPPPLHFDFDGGEEARGLPAYAHEVQRLEPVD